MPSDDPFEALARNGFDFLERAIKEFANEPKYSVIHFCAAVEMLLKARLMKEHWSLIVSKPELASLNKFKAGDFMSVTLEECRQRLRDIAGEDIGEDAHSTFRALANHRNKMVHFFHPDIDGDKQSRERIVAEQCRAWLQLHRLLMGWEQFGHFNDEISRADRAMKKHRSFLNTKFKALKEDLAETVKSGKTLQRCSACDFKAAVVDALDAQIRTLCCRVCDYEETQLEVDCPYCKELIVLANDGYATCPECNRHIEPESLVGVLREPPKLRRAYKDGDDRANPANCGVCEGYQTVLGRSGKYFCASCFDIADSIHQCQWCNEYGTGDMEHSYSFGCSCCSGRLGYEKGD